MPKEKIALELKNITKTFGNKLANNHISMKVRKGTIHVVAGENGAGKSTMMNIIFGLQKPDSGAILINGKKLKTGNKKHIKEFKIGMVHQHFKLVEIFTAIENIIISQKPSKNKFALNYDQAKESITKKMEEFGLVIPLDIAVENLTVDQQQKLEILKLLYQEPEILIFDEPTSVLTSCEIKNLIKVIKKLKAKGKTIVVITHKLDEIKKLADEITVLRRGSVVDQFSKRQLTAARLTKAIVGKSITKIRKKTIKKGKVVLELRKVKVNKIGYKDILALNNVSLKVKEGEILAIAGIGGNGQQELGLVIARMLDPLSGQIRFLGEDVTKLGPQAMYRRGMSHIPANRQHHGLSMNTTLEDNAILQDIDIKPYSHGQIINRSYFKTRAQLIVDSFDVRGVDNLATKPSELSGGNQQKFVVGRELTRENGMFLMIAQPTRGLSIDSIWYVHKQIIKAKEKGKGVIMISNELSDVVALADRVIVISQGKIIDELTKSQINEKRIGEIIIKERMRLKND